MLPTLRTSRLVLAPLGEWHLNRFVSVAGGDSIADTTICVPDPVAEMDARLWIERAVAGSFSGQAAHFAIAVCRDESISWGTRASKPSTVNIKRELSFWWEESCAGRGYATEAARAVIGFGFRNFA